MTNEEKIRGKRLQALLADLGSRDEEKQLAAILSLKVHGNEKAIEPLVQLLSKTRSEQMKQAVIDVLNTVKSSKVPPAVIACLKQEKYAGLTQVLLASIWNSGLDYREYLSEIIRVTLKGDLMHALECLTIIENFEGVPSEEELNESLVILGDYLSVNKGGSSPKTDLLIEIGVLLKRMNDSL